MLGSLSNHTFMNSGAQSTYKMCLPTIVDRCTSAVQREWSHNTYLTYVRIGSSEKNNCERPPALSRWREAIIPRETCGYERGLGFFSKSSTRTQVRARVDQCLAGSARHPLVESSIRHQHSPFHSKTPDGMPLG